MLKACRISAGASLHRSNKLLLATAILHINNAVDICLLMRWDLQQNILQIVFVDRNISTQGPLDGKKPQQEGNNNPVLYFKFRDHLKLGFQVAAAQF